MRVLLKGLSGNDVRQWQRFLISQGFLAQGLDTGNFLNKTDEATRAYQQAHGLTADGEVGPRTLAHALAHDLTLDRPPGRSFYTDVIVNHPLFRSNEPVNDLELLEPIMRQKVLTIIAEAKARGVDLMVSETYRSRERQVELFNGGASGLREVGVHHYGLACDLVRNVNGRPSWKGDFSLVGELAREVGLIWGGVWTKPHDPYHVQRCSLARQQSLFHGDWYPDDNYNPYEDD